MALSPAGPTPCSGPSWSVTTSRRTSWSASTARPFTGQTGSCSGPSALPEPLFQEILSLPEFEDMPVYLVANGQGMAICIREHTDPFWEKFWPEICNLGCLSPQGIRGPHRHHPNQHHFRQRPGSPRLCPKAHPAVPGPDGLPCKPELCGHHRRRLGQSPGAFPPGRVRGLGAWVDSHHGGRLQPTCPCCEPFPAPLPPVPSPRCWRQSPKPMTA